MQAYSSHVPCIPNLIMIALSSLTANLRYLRHATMLRNKRIEDGLHPRLDPRSNFPSTPPKSTPTLRTSSSHTAPHPPAMASQNQCVPAQIPDRSHRIPSDVTLKMPGTSSTFRPHGAATHKSGTAGSAPLSFNLPSDHPARRIHRFCRR